MLLFEYTTGEKNRLQKQLSLFSADPKFYIKMPSGNEEPVFDFKDFPFEIFKNAPVHTKKGKTQDRINYIDLAISFDIETTTLIKEKQAFMYQWQYCIEDYVFMGKTWLEFMEFQEILTKALNLEIYSSSGVLFGRSLVVYIFNLSFEFEFMNYFIGEIINPLITDKYAPLLIHTTEGFTYRCAYRLSNKNLENFTKDVEHKKLKGDLDYNKIRLPVPDDVKNGLTDQELAYCFNDVKGLSEAMRDIFEKDTKYTIANIPLTSTGYVRKDCQKAMRKQPLNRIRFKETALDSHLYLLCREAFRGGNTHANAKHANQVLHNVKSYDIASSYPACILLKTYPIGKFIKIKETRYLIQNFEALTKKFCLLVKFRLINCKYIGKCGVPYLSKSKTFLRVIDRQKIIEDNGRLVYAPYCEITATDEDLRIILRDYKFDQIEIIEAYKSLRGMLPEELRKVCFTYYENKTKLKHSESPEDIYNYNKSKALLNSIYGMCVMRIDRIEYDFIDNDYVMINSNLDKMLDKFYNSESSFLPYQFGVWITAHARARLQLGLDIAGEDTVYCDTDSVKFIGDHKAEFEELNIKLEAEAIEAGAVAFNKEGEPFPIGIYDYEGEYTDFKTLGAKKYIYSYDNGKTIKATISGVAKEIGQKFFTEHGFDAFKDNTVIPISGKVTAHYNHEKPHYINVNGVEILTASNIAMLPASYTIHLTDDYKSFIKYIRDSLKKYYT